MTDTDRRALLLQDLDAISPWDLMEAQQLQETAVWIREGSPLYRTAFDEPDPHLVAYFVVTDPDREELLLGHHRKAGLRLSAADMSRPASSPGRASSARQRRSFGSRPIRS